MPRVLLVEDETEVRAIVAEYLEALGYEVRAAASGRAALELIGPGSEHFDVAIIDWMLPEVGGREVLARLREAQPGCPVVVTTGHGTDVVGDSVVASYSASILRKPFTMRSLAFRVEGLLPGRGSEL